MHLHRYRLPCLFAAFSAVASAQPPRSQDFPAGAEAREARLLAQLTPSVRDWIASEGRRQARSASPDALAAVKARFPDLSQTDIATMILLLTMEIARDARNDMRELLGDMQTVNKDRQAMRESATTKRDAAASGVGRLPAIAATRVTPVPSQAPMATPNATTKQKPLPGGPHELDQLRLQQYTERRAQAMEMLSNLMKKTSDTTSTIVKNLE